MNATRKLVFSAAVAALYAALTLALAPISYGPVQCRVSEAFTLLPFLFPASIPGLFVGCAIANIFSGMGLIDIAAGSLTTLVAALISSRMPKKWLAAIPPVILNAIVIGVIVTYFYMGVDAPAPLWFNMLTVGAGQLAACFGLGLPLVVLLQKNEVLRPYMRKI